MSPTPDSSSGSSSNPLAALFDLPALDNTYGALMIGTYGGVLLFGITAHQAYRYFNMYPKDTWILKGLVIAVVIAEAFTAIISMHICYHSLVQDYLNPVALQYSDWTINIFPLMTGVTMVLSQSFFARRIWLVAPRFRPIVVVAGILCLAEMGFLASSTAKAFHSPTYDDFGHWQWLVSVGSTMAVSADTLLTVVLIIVLRKSRTGIKRTDSMISRMILYSVNTGLLTGIFNLLTMVFSYTETTNLIWVGFGITGAKFYGTTLLAALNSRQSLAERGAGLSNDTSPFGISGVPDPLAYRSNAMGERVNRRVPTELESGRSTDDQDSNDFVIELKRTELGAKVDSTTSLSGTAVPVSLDRRMPMATQHTFVGADRRTADEAQKASPV
ncbi:hypothetical protein PYCCODRAFT_1462629 [Trametes coccinea BRFM310]|uniref:DUF6534 domain-containing protein n=1 Tax=Trametes coccinea (strain BRFM310) TaxID=1353009 RepID=A0A1Y2J7F5_TRAC3|nr:hypothetical protein PYCCODRAFT_1462629 [Trametes coccinea BRFM310]